MPAAQPGTALALFNDFQLTTPEVFLDRMAGKIKNEAAKKTFQFLKRMMFNNDVREMVSFGSALKFDIMFDERSTAQFYKPLGAANRQTPQVLAEAEIQHRFMVDHKAWSKQQVSFNTNDMTIEAQNRFIIRTTKVLEARLVTSMLNKIEKHAWIPAHGRSDDMEAKDGEMPYCLHAFINDRKSGDSFRPDGWTTIQGLDPTSAKVFNKYHNPVVQYNPIDAKDFKGEGNGLEQAFDQMQDELHFELPGKYDEHFEGQRAGQPGTGGPGKQFIGASSKGRQLYKSVLYGRNDRTFKATSLGVPTIDYNGVPIELVEDLGTNAYYDDGNSGFTHEMNAVHPGPRFYWYDLDQFLLEFHPDANFEHEEVMKLQGQWDAYTQDVKCWYNLGCLSRRRGGGVIEPELPAEMVA